METFPTYLVILAVLSLVPEGEFICFPALVLFSSTSCQILKGMDPISWRGEGGGGVAWGRAEGVGDGAGLFSNCVISPF